MTRWTEDDLSTFQRNSGRGLPKPTLKAMERASGKKLDANGAPIPKKAPGPHKFSAEPTTVDGIRFDSKLEARYYDELILRVKAGEILYFLRQVPFHLPGGVIYRVDFMVVSYHTGFTMGVQVRREGARDLRYTEPLIIDYVDCKGFSTQEGKNKIKQTEALYGVKITLVKKVRKVRSR